MGPIHAVMGPKGLVALAWADRLEPVYAHLSRHLGSANPQPKPTMPALHAVLRRYFEGDLAALSTLAIDPPGTPFQRTTWAALRQIPPGQTWSYGRLAKHIGRPTASRAVAQANGRNPIPLVIPCHRVIAANGALGGFSAGLDRKRFLLRLEQAWPPL